MPEAGYLPIIFKTYYSNMLAGQDIDEIGLLCFMDVLERIQRSLPLKTWIAVELRGTRD